MALLPNTIETSTPVSAGSRLEPLLDLGAASSTSQPSLATNLTDFANNIESSALTPQSDVGDFTTAGGDATPLETSSGPSSLSGAQTLGLGVASTALKTAAALHDIKQNEADTLNQMRTDFDRAYGSAEFDARMDSARLDAAAVNQMIQTMNSIRQQGADIPAQDLGRQSQVFLRNPRTGGAV